jgi:predicted nicotinamide N-methyase
MSRDRRKDNDEQDEFWKVALDSGERDVFVQNDSSDDEGDCNDTGNRVSSYELILPERTVSLKLCPLPLTDGIWSLLGGNVWYGSALLAAMLLKPESRIQKHLDTVPARNISCLELGSGAVGLSSLALGLMLSQRQGMHRVCLTDNEADVLNQLKGNVETNVARIQSEHHQILLPNFSVKLLDWNEDYSSDAFEQLHLVVGSELVYTKETAEACASVVRSLLREHPDLLILIIQVTDRDGWNNVFLPTLRLDSGTVVEETSTDASLHETASQMIRHGGTLDRFDFGACYISRKSNLTST